MDDAPVQKCSKCGAAPHPAPTLEEAYRLHYKRVFSVCYGILRDKDEAEDATADVFCHLATRLHQFQGRCRFETWLHRVAYNLTLMRVRRPRMTQSLEAMMERKEAHGGTLERALTRRDAALESVAERMSVRAALEAMPQRQAQLLGLVYLQGWSLVGLGRRMNLPDTTLKARAAHARARFREIYLAQEGSGSGRGGAARHPGSGATTQGCRM